MQLNQARILLTGASGGLGAALAGQLAAAGAALLLSGRDDARLAALPISPEAEIMRLPADLNTTEGVARSVEAARHFRVNVLINNAGVGGFGLLDGQSWPEVERILATNLQAPIHLSQALLPWLKEQPQAAIVNIGSAFGSIPFAGFAAYSAAKAGLRAFSTALRRELADGPVRVIHISPRAIATPLNSAAVNALNAELGNVCDRPEQVAAQIVDALRKGTAERQIGFPEQLFAWLNGAARPLIDRGLAGKLATIKHHARTP